MTGSGTRRPKAAVTAPRLSPVRLEDLEDRSLDFRRGGRHEGARYSRLDADGLELSGAAAALQTLLGALDQPDPSFNIVTP